MTENKGHKERPITHEIKVEDGLRAYPMPELGEQSKKVAWECIIAPTIEVAQQKINDLLVSIEAQGGQLVGILPVDINVPSEPGIIRDDSAAKSKSFLIVKK